ncbi:MAG: cupin domain-containing protein, partial [Geminicoccaceae bacterium]|nr:cupin domain-containing protein [Geminicoccaceae bacterium]
NGIFPFPHYHSNAHEVLAVCRGEAKVRFGGERGEVLEVAAGDVVVIPAGVGHQNLGSSADFLIVGAYPKGQENYDLCRGEPGERPGTLENIRRVPLPEQDPLAGRDGPLIERWRS